MSMYDKTHYNIVISLQLIKINEKKNVVPSKMPSLIYISLTEWPLKTLWTMKNVE